MSIHKDLRLSLNEDTFNGLKTDFDRVLRRVLDNMESKESDSAEMTLKLKISLEKEMARDFGAPGSDAMRNIVKPKFDHSIQSVLTIKDKAEGKLGGNYELVWDEESHSYVMREIANGQTKIEDLCEDETAPELREPLQLASGVDESDVIDVEFTEADDNEDYDDALDEYDDEDDGYSYEEPECEEREDIA